MSHEIDTLATRTGPYVRGWFGVCTCGWTGPEHDQYQRGQALWDATVHELETKKEAAA
jgi:hypothetical protein